MYHLIICFTFFYWLTIHLNSTQLHLQLNSFPILLTKYFEAIVKVFEDIATSLQVSIKVSQKLVYIKVTWSNHSVCYVLKLQTNILFIYYATRNMYVKAKSYFCSQNMFMNSNIQIYIKKWKAVHCLINFVMIYLHIRDTIV